MVQAWNARTGAGQTIPEHWIGHPVLGADYTLDAPDNTPEPACCGGTNTDEGE